MKYTGIRPIENRLLSQVATGVTSDARWRATKGATKIDALEAHELERQYQAKMNKELLEKVRN